MNRREFLAGAAVSSLSQAQRVPPDPARFVQIAESLKPKLRETRVPPAALVRPAADPARFLRWRMEHTGGPGSLAQALMGRGDSVVIDFGRHLTGRFSFAVSGHGRGVDAPARIKFVFGEVPAEVAEPFDPYHGGLSRAWLQDEVINIDVLPAEITLPRRYAFRYAKLEVIDTAPNYKVRFDSAGATALTSASGVPPALPPDTPELLRRIDEVSLATLRDCMQTVFEDGPKRDRRLWIGDLRLQALANYATFRDYDLVKRCLYLFAGLPREDGFVAACAFEEPKPTRGHEYIIDYAALYPATVLDYALASDDWEAAKELWPVCRRQMEILSVSVGADGLFQAPKGSWVFVDWSNALDRTAAMHGIFVYALRQAAKLARRVGDGASSKQYTELADRMTAAARKQFFDQKKRMFVSGQKKQVSWATQAWMALAGIANPEEAREALRAIASAEDAVRPGAPYLWHYVAEAMIEAGLKAEALELVRDYWGGMVKAGADTFWEVYDPKNPMLSPYGNVLINSYCHAWSCTPAYLLRAGLVTGALSRRG